MSKNPRDEKKLDRIKSSVLSRSLTLARLTVGAGTKWAGHGVGTLLSSPDVKEQKWKEFLKDRAGILSQELGELKGSLMKAGQMLSMYGEHFLPPEANELLKSLQSQSPPLEWNVIESVLRKEWGEERWALVEIEKQSIGSASLGQVHRARRRDTGEIVAVKIQYPGVDRAIDSDLRALKSLLSLLKILPRGVTTDHLFAEVREMLVQEMDYEQEARETEKYRERLAGDSRYVVPRVHKDLSTARVLTTSFERGVSPDDPLVNALNQERRNQLASSFLDLYFRELFEWGVVQTDPHLGNYRVRLAPDGRDQLVLLDFGAVRSYPPEFLNPYHKMIEAALDYDRVALDQAARQLKFVHADDNPELKKLFEEFCLGTVEPFLSPDDPRNDRGQINARGEYDWKNSDLPQRLTRKVFEMIQRFPLRSPPREIVFLDRKTGGVFVFLAVLRAHLNGRQLLLKHLKKSP